MKHAMQHDLQCKIAMIKSIDENGFLRQNASTIFEKYNVVDMLNDYENVGDIARGAIKFAIAYDVEKLVDNGWDDLHGYIYNRMRNATYTMREEMLETIIAFLTTYAHVWEVN